MKRLCTVTIGILFLSEQFAVSNIGADYGSRKNTQVQMKLQRMDKFAGLLAIDCEFLIYRQ